MIYYIDSDSLTWTTVPSEVRDQLVKLVSESIQKEDRDAEFHNVDPGPRLNLLARLVQGAGAVVVCGPRQLPFWSGVSHEVRVRIEPDGTEPRRRTSGLQWALEAQGVRPTIASRLAAAPPKVETNQWWDTFNRAVDQLNSLHHLTARVEPMVIEGPEVTVLKEAEAMAFLYDLISDGPVDEPLSLDYEWNKQTLEPVGLAATIPGRQDGDRHFYIPVTASDYQAPPGFGQQLRVAVSELLRSALPTVWHNFKADLQTQYVGDLYDLVGLPHDDTIVMGYVAGHLRLGLKVLSKKLLGRDPLEYPGELADLPVALAARYAAGGDTRNTLDLYRVLRKQLQQQNQLSVYEDIERPIIPAVAAMEQEGHPVYVPELYRLQAEYQHTLDGLAQHVWQKHRLNLWSDKDQLVFATRMLGYNPGTVSTEKLATKSEEPWLDTLIGFRKLRHRKRAFVDKHIERWRRAGYPKDFRAYSNFNQAGSPDYRDERAFSRAPKTGRFSSSSQKRWDSVAQRYIDVGFGNGQNQPGDIRDIFRAPEGCVVWGYDYSGLEMRIGAAMSGDPAMVAVLTEVCPDPGMDGCEHEPKHGDPHGQFQHSAIQLTGVKIDRTIAKNWNFGEQYAAGVDTQIKTLAKARAFLDRDTAVALKAAHAVTYRRSHEYNKEQQDLGVERGYSMTYFGRRRYDEDLKSSDGKTQSHARLAAGNMPIQGTAADLLKQAMAAVVPVLQKYGAHMSMQIHDEIVGWVPAEHADQFNIEMKEVMSSYVINGMQMLVNGGTGRSWMEVH